MTHEILKGRLIKALVDFFDQDYRRICHAVEVLKQSEWLLPHYPDADVEVVLACAVLHDVGIKPSEAELGYNDGKTQEHYGPPIARDLLQQIGFGAAKIDKVADIIGNHHSPSRYDYVELKLLKLADRIVNQLDQP